MDGDSAPSSFKRQCQGCKDASDLFTKTTGKANPPSFQPGGRKGKLVHKWSKQWCREWNKHTDADWTTNSSGTITKDQVEKVVVSVPESTLDKDHAISTASNRDDLHPRIRATTADSLTWHSAAGSVWLTLTGPMASPSGRISDPWMRKQCRYGRRK